MSPAVSTSVYFSTILPQKSDYSDSPELQKSWVIFFATEKFSYLKNAPKVRCGELKVTALYCH